VAKLGDAFNFWCKPCGAVVHGHREDHCEHVLHNPDSMQTVCEKCGAELLYDPMSDAWKVQSR
jgi:hypothetical protein